MWVPRRPLLYALGSVATLLVALIGGEATDYKLGLIGIVFIGAIGLHILVNWGGELSLAHAGFIGLPAFAVAQVSSHSGVTPILVLPIGVIVGALLGLVVATPALRARGLQVALVTLAVGIAIERFLFVRSWVIGGTGGIRIPLPSLFGVRFETSRSLVPVLLLIVLLSAWAARSILDSKVGRGLLLVRANPDAANAIGVPVNLYRSSAYAIAGAFAGLAGSSYVIWVQRVSSKAFPLELGFTYLVIAVLAGTGGLAGVALSAVLIEGGRLFSIVPQSLALYLGPIALIYNVTRYQEGFNGVLRSVGQKWREPRRAAVMAPEAGVGGAGRRTQATVRLPTAVAGAVIVAGFAAIVLAWYHVGNTDQVSLQNQDIISGGLGGIGLIVLGCALLVRDALLRGGADPSGESGGGGGGEARPMAPSSAPGANDLVAGEPVGSPTVPPARRPARRRPQPSAGRTRRARAPGA
ncbi:MAG: branched-chain amino acid ABC transporter permease [Acidimicrobiales bacterium]